MSVQNGNVMISLRNYDKKNLYPPDRTSRPSYRIKKDRFGYKVQQKVFIFWVDLKFLGDSKNGLLDFKHFQTFKDAESGLRIAQIEADREKAKNKTIEYY